MLAVIGGGGMAGTIQIGSALTRAASTTTTVSTAAATKLVNDLTAEEARKECEKLQIITQKKAQKFFKTC